MAYSEQTSVATVADVIDRVASFAAANGWTVDSNVLAGAQRTVTLHKSGVSDYVHIYNTTGSIVRMRISVGYTPGALPSAQPNVSGECVTTLEDGPYPKIFMFASGDQVWTSLAIARNAEYRHFTFGVLDKVGVYNGGTYVAGTDWGRGSSWVSFSQNSAPFFSSSTTVSGGRVRADAVDDARVNFMFNILGAANSANAQSDVGADLGGLSSALAERADRNAFSGRSVVHPIALYAGRVGPSVFYSPIGVVHDVRACSLEKLEAEQEITIGADVWKVFPVAAKRPMGGPSGVQPAASGNYAFAVRKVA